MVQPQKAFLFVKDANNRAYSNSICRGWPKGESGSKTIPKNLMWQKNQLEGRRQE